MSLNLYRINKSWTLFLDRDGVINKRLIDDYVKSVDEFEFLPGVLDAIKTFSNIFSKVIIVTNQQGVTKGIMNTDDLNLVHNHLLTQVQEKGGKIANIYYCTDLAGTGSKNRKPEIGMAMMAKKDFPDIDFEKSIMIGDSVSDMEFGKNTRMKTVFITDKHTNYDLSLVDTNFESLKLFANQLKINTNYL